MGEVSAVIWFDRSRQHYEFSKLPDFKERVAQLDACEEDILYSFDETTARLGKKIMRELRSASELERLRYLKLL